MSVGVADEVMRLRFSLLLIGFLNALWVMASWGQSPVGQWRTIDDKTGETKSIVEIYEVGDGVLEGKVLKVLKSDHGPHPICRECPGERKDMPIEGMVILWGMSPSGNEWKGGRILDPKNGKTYKCKLMLTEDGDLEVRGFIGFSLIGRTQVWEPVESSNNEWTNP